MTQFFSRHTKNSSRRERWKVPQMKFVSRVMREIVEKKMRKVQKFSTSQNLLKCKSYRKTNFHNKKPSLEKFRLFAWKVSLRWTDFEFSIILVGLCCVGKFGEAWKSRRRWRKSFWLPEVEKFTNEFEIPGTEWKMKQQQNWSFLLIYSKLELHSSTFPAHANFLVYLSPLLHVPNFVSISFSNIKK